MDYYANSGGYSDYKLGALAGSNYPYHQQHTHPYGYHQQHHHQHHNHPSSMRYSQTNFRSSSTTNPINGHGTYERFGYSSNGNSLPFNGSSGHNTYAYNSAVNAPIDSRSNQFYAQPHPYTPYDPYKVMAPGNNYPSSYSYHHSYEPTTMYRSRSGGYLMRDSQLYQYGASGGSNHREYASNGLLSRGEYFVGDVQGSSNGSAVIDPNLSQNHHHYHPYQAINGTNYSDYGQSSSTLNQFTTGANGFVMGSATGQQFLGKEGKIMRKSHRDRSLSKLVAMNRRLESQVSMMNESERIGTPFSENYDYFTDYSETPDSMASGQYSRNDYENISNKDTGQALNGSDWHVMPSNLGNNDKFCNSKVSNKEMSLQPDTNCATSDEVYVTSATSKSPAKRKTQKNSSGKTSGAGSEAVDVPIKKRRKRREKKTVISCDKNNDLKADIIPLPGFQQAFGSTEIGRFSEIFFNLSESPIEMGIFESEADTLSPQPWETGDSLDGPHFNMQLNVAGLTPAYAESFGSTDSPSASNNSYFSDLRASEF